MPKRAKPLTTRQVETLKDGTYCDGHGLWLSVKGDGASRSWLFRYARTLRDDKGNPLLITTSTGRQLPKREDHWVGLGPVHTVGLAEARELALAMRKSLRDGQDPLELKRESKRAPTPKKVPTFREMAEVVVETKRSEWKSEKHGRQWLASLEQHVYPHFGDMPVDRVTKDDVLAALTPIWIEKTETATRVRQRIEEVIGYAISRELRPANTNPATRAALHRLLPDAAKVKKVVHHPAVPWQKMNEFMAALRAMPGTAARALELIALTATRSGEVRGATWGEFDLTAKVWSIPGERTKTGAPHRVPLSRQALGLLASMPEGEPDDVIFKGVKGGPLSDMSVSAVMRRMGRDEVPHGLRSSFRDWAAEATNYPRDLCEQALGHKLADAVEAAYRRGDLLERRRELMQTWADHCDLKPAAVADLGKARAKRRAVAG